MIKTVHRRFSRRGLSLTLALIFSSALIQGQSKGPALPNTGQDLTPLGTLVALNPGVPDNPTWTATHAVTSVVSPLGGTMLVLTSGFNRVYNNPLTVMPLLASWTLADSAEHVLIYDITTPTPLLKQVRP